ncbi:N-6 DNA methylase, partial [Acinetobacter pittii]|uniref:N-6 DNA methylase n=3 Tax=Acinetobacter TaxID=469 RepID=UPI003B5012FD
MNIRLTGSFYTPPLISDFICKFIFSKISRKNIKILEPSAGDGSFVHSLEKANYESQKKVTITAVDIDRDELN